jgi:hypothetical protein
LKSAFLDYATAVAQLEHAVCRMDAAADHATPPPLFAGKYDE